MDQFQNECEAFQRGSRLRKVSIRKQISFAQAPKGEIMSEG